MVYVERLFCLTPLLLKPKKSSLYQALLNNTNTWCSIVR